MIKFDKFNVEDYKDALIVADCVVAEKYGIAGDNVFTLPQGETAKTFACAEYVCKWFLSQGLDKRGTVVIVGGGSAGDSVGFAASVYKRGVDHILQVPTTLLSMVDSSIGGKTALNVGKVKNAVGTFIKADTLIDTSFLGTLPKEQFVSGMGEVEKYRLLSREIYSCDKTDVERLVRLCANYKQSIVGKDYYDVSARRRLNLGHTVGHALETEYDMLHGNAVKMGLYYEMLMSLKLKYIDKAFFKRWSYSADIKEIFEITETTMDLMINDKKSESGRIGFVLPNGDFDVKEVFITPEETFELLQM
ncbi:MAG: 3-dehydroquinate synthase [Corallococcus sp.]|nr:3-dehydroquinate synthase [Corallococcus sp.]